MEARAAAEQLDDIFDNVRDDVSALMQRVADAEARAKNVLTDLTPAPRAAVTPPAVGRLPIPIEAMLPMFAILLILVVVLAWMG